MTPETNKTQKMKDLMTNLDTYFSHDPEPPETVTLFADGLLSKWGFSDGDLLDWLYEFGVHDKHAALCAVVRQKLLPALAQKVEVEEIGTCHNPIRARTVDGVYVTNLWYDAANEKKLLTPDSVTVTCAEVLAIARSLPANNPDLQRAPSAEQK